MVQQQPWRAFLARLVVAAGLVTAPGCLCYLHTPPPPNHPCAAPCAGIPKPARDKVHIVLVYGADPFDCANLYGVREFIHHLGFLKVYSGSPLRTGWFASEMRRVFHEEPDARFVLIGYGAGAGSAESLARDVAPDGIVIDTLVYLSGCGVAGEQPENVLRVVSISGGEKSGHDLPSSADERCITDAGHFSTPTHPEALHTLAEELQAVAARVPVVLPPEPPPLIETAPTPRPVSPPAETAPMPRPLPTEAQRDEWDFLKPVPRLEPLPPLPVSELSRSVPGADALAPPTAGPPGRPTTRTPAPASPYAPRVDRR